MSGRASLPFWCRGQYPRKINVGWEVHPKRSPGCSHPSHLLLLERMWADLCSFHIFGNEEECIRQWLCIRERRTFCFAPSSLPVYSWALVTVAKIFLAPCECFCLPSLNNWFVLSVLFPSSAKALCSLWPDNWPAQALAATCHAILRMLKGNKPH